MKPSSRNRPGGLFLLWLFVFILTTTPLFRADPAKGGIVGSYHDFTATAPPGRSHNTINLTRGGPCAACHQVHYAKDSDGIWAWDLSDEKDTNNGYKQTGDPNYVPTLRNEAARLTILCYDCHDDHSSTRIDDEPSNTDFNPDPQDIAWQNGPGADDPTEVGYYELEDGSIPDGSIGGGPRDGSATGGHYWKSEPDPGTSGLPDFEIGDKIPCTLCHDPHDAKTGTGASRNEVMFLKETIDGRGGTVDLNDDYNPGAKLRASSHTRNYTSGTGREMCAECHRFSDDTGSFPLTERFWNVRVPRPPGTVTEHSSASSEPCSECHLHNFVTTNCNTCHGAVNGQFWPDGIVNNPTYAYADDSAGAHDNHVLAIGQYLGYGDYASNPTGSPWASMYDSAQQRAICAFCHPDPGGAGHLTDSGDSRVDVHQDSDDQTTQLDVFRKYTGTGASAVDVDGVDGNQAYNYTNSSCSSLVCHNQNGTPTGGAGDWQNPPDWTATINAKCSNTTCHNRNDTYSISHPTHSNNFQKNYDCVECHLDNGDGLSHQDGLVDMDFAAAGSLEADVGGGNGYYDKDNSGTPSSGDTAFAYKNGIYSRSCNLIYCHGDDSVWGGTDTTPVWDDHTTATCDTGTCHGAYGSVYSAGAQLQSQIPTGNHPTHFQQYDSGGVPQVGVGPEFDPHPGDGGCGDCHNMMTNLANCLDCHAVFQDFASVPTWPSTDHVDGEKDFLNLDDTTVTTLALTDTCDNCHGASTVSAKTPANWIDPSYRLPCLECHDSVLPANSARDDSGVNAPDKDLFYDADDGGHGYNGTYSGTGNTGPNYDCDACHDDTLAHISGVLGDGNRLAQSYVIPGDVCDDCHAPGGGAGLLGDAAVEAGDHSTAVSGNYGGNPAYDYPCEICHDPHGTSNMAMINTTFVDGMGADATGVTLAVETGLDPSTAADDGVCDRCHADGGQAHSLTNHANNHTWGAVCIDCHDHTSSFIGNCTACHGDDLSTPKTVWPDGNPGNNPSPSAYADDEPGGHGAHIALLEAREGFDRNIISDQVLMCAYCHPSPGSSGHDADGGGDQQADVDDTNMMRIDGTSDRTGSADVNLAPFYDTGGKVCFNSDCHYENPTPAYAGAGWDDADEVGNDTTCTTCHADNSTYAVNDLPTAHDAHVASPSLGGIGGKSYDCTQCHPDHGIDTPHLDATVQLDFSTTFFEPGAIQGTAVGSDGLVKYGIIAGTYATCQNFYCHGDELNNGGTDQTPTWNDITTGRCGTCHGVFADPVAQGRNPNLALTSGDHLLHYTGTYGPGFDDLHTVNPLPGCFECHPSRIPSDHSTGCTDCHPGASYGATGPGASIPTAAHVDGKTDFGNTDQGTFAISTIGTTIGPPTADNTDRCDNCHSTAEYPSPGGSIGTELAKSYWTTADRIPCLNCHNATDTAHSAADGSSGVDAPAKELYYAADDGGHGFNGTFSGTGNTGPNYDCDICHDDTLAHISGVLGDGDRLAQAYVNPSDVCDDCHAPGGGAGLLDDAAVEASDHSTTVSGNYSGNGAYDYSCGICHDPHGTDNMAMISTTFVDGMGADATGVTLVVETGLDPSTAADDGVCDRCHADGGQAHSLTSHANNHTWGAVCIDCHDHTSSFIGNCTACHGDDLSTPKTVWPDGNPGNNPSPSAYADDEPGGHEAHIALLEAREGFDRNIISDQVLMCAYCHPSPGSSGHDADGGGDQQADVDDTNMMRIDGTSDGTGSADLNLAPFYDTVGKVCFNSDCHYENPTPAYAGTGWDGADEVGNDTTCTTCHADDLTYTDDDLPDAHNAHVLPWNNGGGQDLACTQCHPDHIVDYAHLSGTVDLDFTGTLGEPGGTQGSQSGSDLAVKYGALAGTYATCGSFYCHGDDLLEGGTLQVSGGTDSTPTWNVLTDGNCGTCHSSYGSPYNSSGTARNQITTGNHPVHFRKYDSGGVLQVDVGPQVSPHPSTGCYLCHNVYTNCTYACHLQSGAANMVNSSHSDGKVDFRDDTGFQDHWNPQSLTDTPACDNCHGASTANAKDLVNWADSGFRLQCLECHETANPANSHINDTGVDAPAKDLYYDVDDGGHGYSGTFSGTGNTAPNYDCDICHDDTLAHISGTLDDEDRLAQGYVNPGDVCDDCHEPGGGAGLLGDAAVEASDHSTVVSGNYGSNGSYDYTCEVCHDPHGTSNIAMIETTIVDGMGDDASGVTLTGETDLDPSSTADDGVCDRCHDNGAQSHSLTLHANNHNWGVVCISCHDHTNTFIGKCVDCHDSGGIGVTGNTRATTPEFGYTSHHVTVGSLVDGDCLVCHNQATEEAMVIGNFGDIHLQYPDSGGDLIWETASNVEKSQFCAECHDADGATVSWTDGAGASATQPFSDGAAVPVIPAAWNSSSHMEASGGNYTCFGGDSLTDGCHASHGSQSEKIYAPRETAGISEEDFCYDCHDADGPAATDMQALFALNNHHDVDDTEQSASGSAVECVNCHNPHLDRTSAKTVNPDNGDTAWAGTEKGFCLTCHDGSPPDGTNPPNLAVVFPASGGWTGYDKSGVEGPHDGACSQCHTSHGSNETAILTGSYSMAQYDQPTYNSADYDMCWSCHNETAVFSSNSTFSQEDYHDYHARTDFVYACYHCHDTHQPYDTGERGYVDFEPGVSRNWDTSDLPMDTYSTYDLSEAFQAGTIGVPDSGWCHIVCHAEHTTPDKTYTPGSGGSVDCAQCHGGGLLAEGNQNWWPDTQAANGNRWPNRDGGATPHTRHVTRIAEVVNGTATPTTTQKNATCGWCHPTGRHTGDATDHANPPATLMDGGSYLFKNIAGANNIQTTSVTQDPGGDGTWDDNPPSDDEVTCSSVDCHYTRDMGATDWYSPSYNSNSCDYCHFGIDASTYTGGATPDLPNAHTKHVDEAADGGYNMICNTCHPVWGGTFDHQDGQIDISWTIPGPEEGDRTASGGTGEVKFGAGNSGDYMTCSGLICHGDWDDSGIAFGGGNNYAANWFNTAAEVGAANSDGRCGTCHGDATLATAPNSSGDDTDRASPRVDGYSGVHTAHIDSNTDTDCGACHYDPLGTNGTYGNPAEHADRVLRPIAFDPAYAYEGVGAAYAGGTCSAVRCHNGVTTPAFTAGSIACGDCHNTGGTGPLPSAASVAGSHATHANNDVLDFTDCDNCHGDGTYNVSGSRGGSAYTATGGGGASPVGLHQNLSVDMYIDPFTDGLGVYDDQSPPPGDGAGGVNFNAADANHFDDGQCSSTDCHGAGTPQWGGTLTNGCFDCHTGAESNLKPVEPAGDGPNPVSLAEYDAQGHGNASTFTGSGTSGPDFDHTYSGAPNDGCYECHDLGAQHAPSKSASDPYRLGATYATDVDGLCDGCHGPGGSAGVVDIEQHTKAITGSSRTWPDNYDFKCVDCHDPHGGANYYMVKSFLSAPTSAGDTNFGSNSYGTPQDPASVSGPINFTDLSGKGADSYAEDFWDGICEVCHNQNAYYNRGDGGSQDHNTGGRCTSCHEHSSGFQGSCTNCHGDDTATPKTIWPDGNPGNNPTPSAYADDEPGSHDEHIALLEASEGFDRNIAGDQIVMCGYCHPSPGAVGHDADGGSDQQADVDAAGMLRIDGVSDKAGSADVNQAPAYSTAAKVCSNSDCHYENDSPSYTNGWDDGDAQTPDCLSCHFYRDGVTYTGPYTLGDLPNAHQVHVGGIPAPDEDHSKSYPCSYCHTVPASTSHLNAAVDLTGTGSPNAGGDEVITQADLSVKYGTLAAADANCAGFYCHGSDFDAAIQGTDITPVWNDHTTGICGNCHDVDWTGDYAQPFDQGAHLTHLSSSSGGAAYGPQFGGHYNHCARCHGFKDYTPGGFCGMCHQAHGTLMPGSPGDAGYAWEPSLSHVETPFEVDFADQDRGWNLLTDPFVGTGTLNPLGTTEADGTDICNRCHSTYDPDGGGAQKSGAALSKENWETAAYRLECLKCHNNAGPAQSTPVFGGVAAPDQDLYYDANDGGHGYNGTFTGTGNSGPGYGCDTCHDDSLAHISGTLDDEDRLASGLTPSTICPDCHAVGGTGGVLGPDASVEASDHSTTISGNYAGNTAYDYTCAVCHDPHGTSNMAMVNTTLVDGMGGDALGVTLAAETGLDPSSAADDGVCDRCHADGSPAHSLTNLSNNHNWGIACLGCHDHTDTFTASCEGCHGTAGSNYWPDSGALGTDWPNREGAHQEHVTAIANANGGVETTDGSACDWCHPGGAHSGEQSNPPADIHDGTTTQFKTMTGGIDSDATFDVGTSTCSGIDCHGGTTTPDWYYIPDTAMPAWAPTYPDSGIAAVDPTTGEALDVTWNPAADAYPSDPVTYDLYVSTDSGTVFDGVPVYTGITGTSTTVFGLTDGVVYYFGIRAMDSWPLGPNETNNTDISAGMAPSSGGSSSSDTIYYLTKPPATTLWGAVQTNMAACSTQTGFAAAVGLPPPGRGGLETAQRCGSPSVYNSIYVQSQNTVYEDLVGFYTLSTYTEDTLVQGLATGNNMGYQGLSGTEDIRIYLAAVDSSGNHTLSAEFFEHQDIGPNPSTVYLDFPQTPDLSDLSISVPAGSRLALLLQWRDVNFSQSTYDRVGVDNHTLGILNRVTLRETPTDATAPVFSGGVSGITVTDLEMDGVLQISWNTATEGGSPTTPPVVYDLYRSTVSAAEVWNNLYMAGLGSTSFQETGMVNGLTYYYGVRARDSFPLPNVTVNTDTSSGVSTRGPYGCNACHDSPPTTGGGAGSHARHADGDADYGDCDGCHPGTSSYSNAHQDGVGQLGFGGTAVPGDYTGGQLTYTDGSVIYSDTDGYGILTGSAGDGVDDGTCSSTQCHGSATPVWGAAGSVGCGSCHGSAGGETPEAPTVNASSAHVDADGGGGAWAPGDCAGCHAGHYQGVRIPLPPTSWDNNNGDPSLNMQSRLGISYGTGGIHLGGPGTAGSIGDKYSEAEICWSCHDNLSAAISEWGYNTKTTPTGFPFVAFATQNDGTQQSHNYGWLYNSEPSPPTYPSTKTSDWTDGYWMSEYDPYLARRVVSTHSVNFDPAKQSSSVAANVRANGTVDRTSPTMESKASLRCSYCHDVHDTFGPGGKPYLRGNWVGNPYPAEVPPRAGYTYTRSVNTISTAINTPRAMSLSYDKGGYFIDQNSNWPINNGAMDTLGETGELCTLCHGTDVDDMDYYTGSTMWLPGMVNGHSNSTLGGTRSNAVDIFTADRYGYGMALQQRVPSTPWVCGSYGSDCDPSYPQSQYMAGRCETNCNNLRNSGWFGGPVNSQGQGGGDFANWYGVGTIGGMSAPGDPAHEFTCSKCHSPHASGLPALLIHNCIDPSLGNWTIRGQTGANLMANNCHRKTTTTDGWHKLAPGE